MASIMDLMTIYVSKVARGQQADPRPPHEPAGTVSAPPPPSSTTTPQEKQNEHVVVTLAMLNTSSARNKRENKLPSARNLLIIIDQHALLNGSKKWDEEKKHGIIHNHGMDDHVSDEIDGAKGEQVPNHVCKKANFEFLVCKHVPNHGGDELVDKGRTMKRKMMYDE
ncbi:hypothetical protein Tco_1090484 [Tanacetum coccineum]|uniref:Uncharacterized protein n=1 Tax=Tanacetum coccineum TaxID=301880 RepID=A0ABQ5I4B3_9ASTR